MNRFERFSKPGLRRCRRCYDLGADMPLYLQTGLELALIGMGTVFLFLGLLVVVTLLMSVMVNKIAPEKSAVERPGIGPVINEQLLAVLQDAVRQHRARKIKH